MEKNIEKNLTSQLQDIADSLDNVLNVFVYKDRKASINFAKEHFENRKIYEYNGYFYIPTKNLHIFSKSKSGLLEKYLKAFLNGQVNIDYFFNKELTILIKKIETTTIFCEENIKDKEEKNYDY